MTALACPLRKNLLCPFETDCRGLGGCKREPTGLKSPLRDIVDVAREEVEQLRSQRAYVGLESGITPQRKAALVSGHNRRLRAAERRYAAARRGAADDETEVVS